MLHGFEVEHCLAILLMFLVFPKDVASKTTGKPAQYLTARLNKVS
jgi:hypothetical protein